MCTVCTQSRSLYSQFNQSKVRPAAAVTTTGSAGCFAAVAVAYDIILKLLEVWELRTCYHDPHSLLS
jgi:hypothetical protein